MSKGKNDGPKTWTEEIEIAGGELIEKVKALIAEGNVRELRIKARGGQVIFETPVTVGVLAGGAVALAAPWLAILGALAALVARIKIEVVREGDVEQIAKKTTTKASPKKPTAKVKRTATAKSTAKKPTAKRAATTKKPAAKTKRAATKLKGSAAR
jgi:hypothetical protein